MKKSICTAICILFLMLIGSCSSTRQTTTNRNLKLSLQAGANIGGITENTDMTIIPDVKVPAESKVDAFTGATRLGYNVGVHTSKKLKSNMVEAGIDYMYNFQTFNYIDAGNFYIGVRRLQVSQIMLPISYNLVLFKNLLPSADIELKIGLLGQLNFVSVNETGILPAYSVNPCSIGPTFGLSAYPFQFNNGNKLGFFFDGYRGTRIYEDFYNQPYFEMPGSSFIKFGLKYQFN